MKALEATATWTYTTATLRQANAATTNQLDCVIGVAEVEVTAEVIGRCQNDQIAGQAAMLVAIGEDSTTTASSSCLFTDPVNYGASLRQIVGARLRVFPAVGHRTFVWLEASSAVGTTTWGGVNSQVYQSGIIGEVLG